MLQYSQIIVKQNMLIPLVDLSFPSTEITREITKVVRTGDFILGRNVEIFEKKFGEYIGVKYCVGVASGADALLLSLKALGIGKGDEVVIPAMTFIATATAVLHADAMPVMVDIRSDLPLIDCSKIEQKITKKTKAII